MKRRARAVAACRLQRPPHGGYGETDRVARVGIQCREARAASGDGRADDTQGAAVRPFSP